MFIQPKSKRELARAIADRIACNDTDIILGTASVSDDAQLLTELWDKYKDDRTEFGNAFRCTLAHNAGAPAQVLEEIYLAAPDDETIRAACLTNPSMPMAYVQDAADSSNAELRKLAARNPGVDDMTLLRLSKDPDDGVAYTAFETMRRKCRT